MVPSAAVSARVMNQLGTGLRIGETLAVTRPALDLDAATVEVRGTVVRVKGKGLIIQPKPKTWKRWRRLHLPAWLVAVLAARQAPDNEWDVIFPSHSASSATARTRTPTSAMPSTRSASDG